MKDETPRSRQTLPQSDMLLILQQSLFLDAFEMISLLEKAPQRSL
jgi:hypothetical protein